jgi:hypothetical protein
MSLFDFGKPKWFKQLPSYYRPDTSKVQEIENFRIHFGFDNELFIMMISMTPWGVRKLQYFMLEKFKKENPFLSRKELWKAVIHSKLNAKIMTLEMPPPFYANPLSLEEINSILANLNEIVGKFKSFEELVDYLVEIDRNEGWYTDPSGLGEELNDLLENDLS